MGRAPSDLRELLTDPEVMAISRRYFVSNGFDGTLTSIGLVVGAYLSGVPDGLTVVKIGLGAAIGLGTSGVWSVWEIERAETRAERLRVEQAMLTDLDDTRIARRHEGARKLHALMSALGPSIGFFLTLVPFLLEGVVLSFLQAVIVSIALGIGLLAAFGAYMGSMSGQRWYVAAFRMGLAGVVVALINVAVPG